MYGVQSLRTHGVLELPQVIAIIRQAFLLNALFEVSRDRLSPYATTRLLMLAAREQLALQANDKCFGLGAVDTACALT
jgi:hypothetical protein